MNKNITIENKPFLWPKWHENGINFVQQLLNENSDFLSVEEFNQRYNLNTNFVSLYQIRKALPFTWRQSIQKLNEISDIKLRLVPGKTSEPKDFTHLNTKALYWMILDDDHTKHKTEPACKRKWNQLFNIREEDWSSIFLLPFQTCRSTRLQSFQYRLIHRHITCNYWLYKCKIKDDPKCSFCEEDDTIEHFFLDCDIMKTFWQSLLRWWKRVAKYHPSGIISPLDNKSLLLGITENSKTYQTINFIVLIAKKIHTCICFFFR